MEDNFINKFSPLRRKVFKYFTSNYSNTQFDESEIQSLLKKESIRVLITRPNHRLGNQLLISPLIQEVENTFIQPRIDLVVNGKLSEILFNNYKSINTIFCLPIKPFKNILSYLIICIKLLFIKYDIGITACESSNSSKIFIKLSRSKHKIYNIDSNTLIENHISKKPIDNLRRYLKNSSDNFADYPPLSIKLKDDQIQLYKTKFSSLIISSKINICLFTNATGSKKHSKDWWKNFIKEIEKNISNVNIFELLPKENISQLDFMYPSIYSADLIEMACLINLSDVFIGADSGVLHLASTSNTIVYGLFNGSTNPDVYGPYGYNKQSINTNKTNSVSIVNDIKEKLNISTV